MKSSKKPRTDALKGGEGGDQRVGKQVIDLEDQREHIRPEGPPRDDSLMEEELNAPRTPTFETYIGRSITYADCAGLSSMVVYGILRAGSLPKDNKKAPKDPTDLIGEVVQYLVLLDDAFADEHEQARLAREVVGQHQKNFEKFEELRKAAELREKKAEEDLVALEALVQSQLTAADHKGYDKGYDKATVEYQKQVREIVADFYTKRFKAGVKWYHEQLIAKLNPAEDFALWTLPEPPPEELAMPEHRS
ncbi:hypothetical protein RHMOL_Rhmol12G0082100 [Rhododendron molle]|uniref:Uncharacterized protein n=1 Tax=Rhododendron molle TaxID=49168 RepID=A0ACC0LG66_RHOML|nr:hypothetical protein RHMOL_Rhmol12G0082100 [Rhododendron molle]